VLAIASNGTLRVLLIVASFFYLVLMQLLSARSRSYAALCAILVSSCGTDVAGPSMPAAMSALPGTAAQTGTAGAVVATAPGVKVVDASGNPVSGVTVSFAVTSGGGSVAGGGVATNAVGVATVGSWTLGTTAGTNTLTASTQGIPTVSFSATGTAGPAATATFTPQSPIALVVGATKQLTSVVKDQYGNVIANPSLSYSSNNNGIATINSTGLITGVSIGSTLLTVSGAGPSNQLTVVVSAPPPGP
jgi:hypothetical protein